MRATFHITSGPYVGRVISLREGQLVQFGRTEWADLSFPADAAMSDVHFSVESRGAQCLLHDLKSATGTLVDEQAVTRIALQTGMSITAGQTSFVVVLGNDAWPPSRVNGENPSASQSAETSPVSPIRQLAIRAALSEPALALVHDEQSPSQLLAVLCAHQLDDDALALLTTWLSKRQSVAWLCRCLRLLEAKFSRPRLDAANGSALALAERWAEKPNDDLGRKASAAADVVKHQTPAAWAALAAHYSGSSLAPASSEPVPPPDDLSSTAVRTAFALAIASLTPVTAHAARDEFLQLGLAMAQQESK